MIYLGYAGVGELLGISPATVRSYHRYALQGRNTLPPPDVMIGGLPGWRRETIEDWNAARPGPGWWGDRESPATVTPPPAKPSRRRAPLSKPPEAVAKPTGKRARKAG